MSTQALTPVLAVFLFFFILDTMLINNSKMLADFSDYCRGTSSQHIHQGFTHKYW